MIHYSVLLKSIEKYLVIKKDANYLDGTLGRGGYTKMMATQNPSAKILAFDLDLEAIKYCKEYLKDYPNITYINDNYCNFTNYSNKKFDFIVLDLGVSSPQFDDASRGFSYRFDSRLDMRMNQNQSFSAYQLVNQYSLQQLTEIFKKYADEYRFAHKVAKNIIKHRSKKAIETTFELVEIIKEVIPMKEKLKKHPAKTFFQAIRIEVNDELASLEKMLEDASNSLEIGGRLVIVSFHSLEDKMVKYFFNNLGKEKVDKRIPISNSSLNFKVYKKETANQQELSENHRSHSAIMRVLERIK